ncbi:MAG TPA: hypothetical protein VNZ53_19355 [Steroidobacteraceae bacterium]|jgi:hypothetical protein|nr:hypothetical protein [Steroidobacteraceae bacterium]
MSPIYAIIVMAFINGNPVDEPVVLMGDTEHNLTEQSCPKFATMVIDHVRKPARTYSSWRNVWISRRFQ